MNTWSGHFLMVDCCIYWDSQAALPHSFHEQYEIAIARLFAPQNDTDPPSNWCRVVAATAASGGARQQAWAPGAARLCGVLYACQLLHVPTYWDKIGLPVSTLSLLCGVGSHPSPHCCRGLVWCASSAQKGCLCAALHHGRFLDLVLLSTDD